MKNLIAPAALIFALAAPAAAEINNVEQFFALSNDSAAERIVDEASVGNPVEAALKFALTNESPAETKVNFDRARDVDVKAIQKKFALTNESPAENFVQ